MNNKKLSQGERQRQQHQKALAAEPPLLAMSANVDPSVGDDTARHLRVLRDAISFAKLSSKHPLRLAWMSPTSLARFQLHHLADDLLALEGVDGLDALVKCMVTSADTYEDFRFELRTAANIARSGESIVTRLAGHRTGPDIELRSTNGKECGVACYRARGEAVSIEEVHARCFDVMTEFGKAFYKTAVGVDVGLEVIFPRFPPTDDDWREAAVLLPRLWHTSAPPELRGDGDVEVRRCLKISSQAHLGIRRRARVRFLFRVAARERFRCIRHIEQKLAKEDRWARAFDGIPLFAYQASPWDSLPKQEDLAALLLRSQSAVQGVIATEISYPVFGNVAHSFENFGVHAPGLHLSLCTYGQNERTWAGDAPALIQTPEHADTFWDASEQGGVVVVVQSKPLDAPTKRMRVPEVSTLDVQSADRAALETLAQRFIQMRDEDDPFEW